MTEDIITIVDEFGKKKGMPDWIQFEEIMVDMICEINQAFHDMIIWRRNGKKTLYMVNLSKQYTERYLVKYLL